MDRWTISISIYAAVVATGALALEVRRWFESGPRLSIDIMPEAQSIDVPGTENATFLLANVSNQGDTPTTIKYLGLRDYGNHLGWLRSKSVWASFVPNPSPFQGTRNLPKLLRPGEVWNGVALHDEELKKRLDAGWLYVEIGASYRSKPIRKRVPAPAKRPEDTEEI